MDPLQVANLGLGWLGVKALSSLSDDPSVAGRRVAGAWDGLRDAVLEDRDWSFATQRISLSRDPTAPAFFYPSRYALPSTVIRVIWVREGSQDGTLRSISTREAEEQGLVQWDIESADAGGGGTLRYVVADTSCNPLYAKVISRIEDASLWSAAFCQALAARLAADLCVPLTENRALAADLWQLYRAKLEAASTSDSRQGSPRRIVSDWYARRRKGG